MGAIHVCREKKYWSIRGRKKTLRLGLVKGKHWLRSWWYNSCSIFQAARRGWSPHNDNRFEWLGKEETAPFQWGFHTYVMTEARVHSQCSQFMKRRKDFKWDANASIEILHQSDACHRGNYKRYKDVYWKWTNCALRFTGGNGMLV